MYPRVNYEMSEEDLSTLLEACKPVPCMMIGSYRGSSPQENANDAWAILGTKLGFDSTTVQPIQGKGSRFFSAVPSETPEQRQYRLDMQANEERAKEIIKLRSEIKKMESRVEELSNSLVLHEGKV